MYDLSFKKALPPDKEVERWFKGHAPTFKVSAAKIFDNLCDTQNRHISLIAYILKSLSEKDKKAIRKALEIDFKYYCMQQTDRRVRRAITLWGGRAIRFYPKNTSAKSFMRSVFHKRLYVVRDKKVQRREFQETPSLDEVVAVNFNYFLSHLPIKIKNLDLNIVEEKLLKNVDVKQNPNTYDCEQTVRTYHFSLLSKDFLLYCYKYFSDIPYLEFSKNKSGNIARFLNFNGDISAFKLGRWVASEEDDDLFLLYDIEQHFMPYAMAVIYEKMPNISDDLLQHIKALSAPMTRLAFVKIIAKYILVNRDYTETSNGSRSIKIGDIEITGDNTRTVNVSTNDISDSIRSLVPLFPALFYYYYCGSIKKIRKIPIKRYSFKRHSKKVKLPRHRRKLRIIRYKMRVDTTQYKKEVNKQIIRPFEQLHKKLANSKYQEFYTAKYYVIMNLQEEFYNINHIVHEDIARLDKNLELN